MKLKALADENRLAIVRFLFLGSKTVSEITRATGKSQPNTSIALKQLLYSQIITREKEGKYVHYSLKDKEGVKKALELIGR
jgi:ArsR family transcriptional regulator